MNKILIANIGNRNLKIKSGKSVFDVDKYILANKQTHSKYVRYNNKTGKEDILLSNFFKDRFSKGDDLDLSLQILEISDIKKKKINEIILFASKQKDKSYNHQDTYYAAQIIKRKLEQQLKKMKVRILIVGINPTETDALIPVYQRALQSFIQSKIKNDYFIVLDAGGTSQMKLALKMVLNHYFLNKHEVFYKNPEDKLSDKPPRNYQLLLSVLNQIRHLVEVYDFHAALFVLNDFIKTQPAFSTQPDLIRIQKNITIIKDRLTLVKNNSFRKDDILINSLNDYFLNNCSLMKDYGISPNRDSVLFELANICLFYFDMEEYTFGVAIYYRFVEQLCQSFMSDLLNKKIDNEEERNEILAFAKKEWKSSNLKYGLPFLLEYIIRSKHESLKQTSLKRYIEKVKSTLTNYQMKHKGDYEGLNNLRNQCYLAHSNKNITLKKINRIVSGFWTPGSKSILHDILKLDKHIYVQHREEILQLLDEFDLSG